MLRTLITLGGVAVILAGCTDDQLREMARAGTYEGQPVYRIDTEVRLPATEEKVAEFQQSTINARAARLCSGGGHKVIEEGRYVEVERLYDIYYGGYWGGGWGGWNAPRYRVAEQSFKIICMDGQAG